MPDQVFSNDEQSSPTQTNAASTVHESLTSLPVLLKCIRAQFFNPKEPSRICEGILALDDASTNSYIKSQVAQELNLTLTPTTMNLCVFNTPACKPTQSFLTQFGIKLADGRSLFMPIHSTI